MADEFLMFATHFLGRRTPSISQGGYTVAVSSLPSSATESDVVGFFAFCGQIEHVEIARFGEPFCNAYVTFKEISGVECAVLLSGTIVADHHICISSWGVYSDEYDPWNEAMWKMDEETNSTDGNENIRLVPTFGKVVTMAQEVVKAMIAKGYGLGQDAFVKAGIKVKAFDESYKISSTAVAKVTEFSRKIGLTDKIYAGMGVAKTVNEKYHVSEGIISAATCTGRKAMAAANAVVCSSYFSRGALWVSDVLNHASQVAADLGSYGLEK